MSTIHLTPKDIPAYIPASIGYNGRMFKVEICEQVELHDTYWSGGTRSSYHAVDLLRNLVSGSITKDSAPAGFGRDLDGSAIRLSPGNAIVKHTIFCGKDMGLTIFIHPDNAPKFLPAPSDDITIYEKIVLVATRSLKASYGGIKDFRFVEANKYTGITREQWDNAKTALINKGLLNKAGAITPNGRNYAGSENLYNLKLTDAVVSN